MEKVIISKREYQKLFEKAMRYEYIYNLLTEDFFASPPLKNIRNIIKEFKSSKKYNSDFLKSLEKGLSRSSYFKK